MAREKKDLGWYGIFIALAVFFFVLVYVLTGKDAVGAAFRVVWSGGVFVVNAVARVLTSFVALLARGVGFRRASRIFTAVGGIGLGYAGAVVLNVERLRMAHDWREWFRRLSRRTIRAWQGFHLLTKIAVVVALISVQLYLHWVLIVFPIGFLVPVVRRAWVQLADTAFGEWYWRTFGPLHRAALALGRQLPVVRHLIGCIHLTRLRYLTAWRLWRHHPRYRDDLTGHRVVSFVEPVRLWLRGELDIYVGRPLLSGRSAPDDTGTTS